VAEGLPFFFDFSLEKHIVGLVISSIIQGVTS
jgi:hypothetical protein